MKNKNNLHIYDWQEESYNKFHNIFRKIHRLFCLADMCFFLLLLLVILFIFFNNSTILNCISFLFCGLLFYMYFKSTIKIYSVLCERKWGIIPDNINFKSIFVLECCKCNFSFDEIDSAIETATQKKKYSVNLFILVPILSVVFTGILQNFGWKLFESICKKIDSNKSVSSLFSEFLLFGNSTIVTFFFLLIIISIVCMFIYKYFVEYREQQFIDSLKYFKFCSERSYSRKVGVNNE